MGFYHHSCNNRIQANDEIICFIHIMELVNIFYILLKMLQEFERIMRAHKIKNKVTLELVLHGTEKLSYTSNTKILDAVHSFIRTTGRNP